MSQFLWLFSEAGDEGCGRFSIPLWDQGLPAGLSLLHSTLTTPPASQPFQSFQCPCAFWKLPLELRPFQPNCSFLPSSEPGWSSEAPLHTSRCLQEGWRPLPRWLLRCPFPSRPRSWEFWGAPREESQLGEGWGWRQAGLGAEEKPPG